MKYDGFGRQQRWVFPSKTAALAYDPLGRLFQTSGGSSGIIQFFYDDDALITEYNSAGAMIHRYVHGPEKGEDDPLIWYNSLTSGWRQALVADQQGSIIAVADQNGNPIAINAYDEYGIPKFGNVGRFQYTGQAWIPELGMYHYKSRVYSPTLGRFLQVDRIGYEGGINLYAYVDNDPVNEEDPTGNCPWCVKAVVDFGIEVGIQYMTTGKVNVRQAAVDTAKGMLNPAKTLERVRDLGRLATAAKRVACCFAAGTAVLAEKGQVSIENLAVGDRVWSSDPATGRAGWHTIIQLYVNDEKPIWNLTIAALQDEEIHRVTDNHLYWVVSLGWTEVRDLRPGMILLSKDGSLRTVVKLQNTGKIESTYNLEVEGLHSFFVGASQVLVHNGCVYRVPGRSTPSGKGYIGRTKADSPSGRADAKGRRDGRDRTDPKTKVIGRYDSADTKAGRRAEQDAINKHGGIRKLDNKRNEIKE